MKWEEPSDEEKARYRRLQARFDAVKEAVAKTVGPDKAFVAGFVAHAMIIEEILKDYLETIQRFPEREELFRTDIHDMLLRHTLDVIEYLKLNPGEILDLVESFKQVMKDVLTKRG